MGKSEKNVKHTSITKKFTLFFKFWQSVFSFFLRIESELGRIKILELLMFSFLENNDYSIESFVPEIIEHNIRMILIIII